MGGRIGRALPLGAIGLMLLYLAGCTASASVHPGVPPLEPPPMIVITAGRPVGRLSAPGPSQGTPEPATPAAVPGDAGARGHAGSSDTMTPQATPAGVAVRSAFESPLGAPPISSASQPSLAGPGTTASQVPTPAAGVAVPLGPSAPPYGVDLPRLGPPLTLPNAGAAFAELFHFDPTKHRCEPAPPLPRSASTWPFYAAPGAPLREPFRAGLAVDLHFGHGGGFRARPLQVSVSVVGPGGELSHATFAAAGVWSTLRYPANFDGAGVTTAGIYTVLWERENEPIGCSGFVIAE